MRLAAESKSMRAEEQIYLAQLYKLVNIIEIVISVVFCADLAEPNTGFQREELNEDIWRRFQPIPIFQ